MSRSPPPFASATATTLAARWVVDALAGDEALDFPVLKALVAALPECLTGAPEATRERVALRCLQEVASLAPADDAPATSGVLRVDAARSCEDMLLELIGQVGSSGTLDKDMLPPFNQDIQNIICMKKSTLPETSFELLKEIDPEIASMVPSSQLEQDGTNQHDNDQSLCSSHDHINKDNAEFRQETSANLVSGNESRNLEKDPITPTFVHQPCTSDNKSCDHQQEDDPGAVGLGASPPDPEQSSAADENVPLGAVQDSVGHDATLQGSATESLTKDMGVHADMIQPQSPREQYTNASPHHIAEEGLHDDDARAAASTLGGSRNDVLDRHAAAALTLGRSSDALATNASEHGHLPETVTPEDTTMISQPSTSKTDTIFLQHESGHNQFVDDVSASIQPMEKDHVREELTAQTVSALPSVSCSDAVQGGQPEINHLPGNSTEHATVFEEQNGANIVDQGLHDDANILEKNTVHDGLNVQAAPLSQNCNLALQDKTAEANCLCEQNTEKSRTDAQNYSCSTSVPNITQNGTGTTTTNTSIKTNLGHSSAGIPHVSSSHDSLHGVAAAGLQSMTNKMPSWPSGQEINDSQEGLSQQNLCIKCGEAGQLLKCSGCLLAAHDSCFGSSVTFQGSDLFYCPVCFYTKATEAYQKAKKTYYEARKNLATFLGTTQVVGQDNELLTGVLPGASHEEVSESSKRKNTHQNEGANLAHRDEEPDQQRKKQKVYATGHGYPGEIVTEKASPVRNSNTATMNKHSVLKENSNDQVQDAERHQHGKSKQAGHGNASHETRRSSQNRFDPPANQEVEADKEDGPTKSHQSNDSDEIEATSSDDSGKRSSPPWRKIRRRKSISLEKETMVSNNSRKAAMQDQLTSSPSRKRNYAPQRRYSNPVAPTGRRSKLSWTEEEESTLQEAMAKFAPKGDGHIPWVQILEYGRDVFHRTRLPSDLRVKWRNMMKKARS